MGGLSAECDANGELRANQAVYYLQSRGGSGRRSLGKLKNDM